MGPEQKTLKTLEKKCFLLLRRKIPFVLFLSTIILNLPCKLYNAILTPQFLKLEEYLGYVKNTLVP